jgi:hypothetical protein
MRSNNGGRSGGASAMANLITAEEVQLRKKRGPSLAHCSASKSASRTTHRALGEAPGEKVLAIER